MWEKRYVYRMLEEKQEGKRPLGRPIYRQVEMGWGGLEWIDVVQDSARWRVPMTTGMNLRIPSIAEEFLSSCTTRSFSRTGSNRCRYSVTHLNSVAERGVWRAWRTDRHVCTDMNVT
jgi:hypothetical protein